MSESDPSLGDLLSPNSSSPGSPLFDFLTAFAPRKLKDLFRLCEYLYFNSSQIYAALQKFAIYPVTQIEYSTTNESLKTRYKKLHDKQLKTKRHLIRAAIDKFVYGNGFYSVYAPFIRFLKCRACGHLANIGTLEYKFKLKKLEFRYTCPGCSADTTSNEKEIIDRPVIRPEKIAVIRWDPKLMDIDYNPVTGHSIYYYTVPKEMKERINKGNKHLINTLPLEFLKTIRDDKTFEFAEGKIFHLKMDAPAGIEAQWGFPPLASTIKLFFYAAVLRKANEAIGLDYVVPFRIISPKQGNPNGDPVISISLERWVTEMKTQIKRWRRDPLHMMWSPVPAEITTMGGQARALMVNQEIQMAEDNIIAALGIPKEFLYGGLSFTGSAITLRILENQLLPHTSELIDMLQWITDNVGRLLGWPTVEVDLAPFKFIDDVQQKTLLLQLNQTSQTGPFVSNTTIAETFDIDLNEERDKRKQEALDEVRFQQELQVETAKLQNTLAQRVQAQAAMGQNSLQYDQQAVIAQADGIVQQMMGLDPGSRRSQLHALEVEDKVMYAVVVDRMKDMQTQQNHEALTMGREQAREGDPSGGPAEGGTPQPGAM